VLDEPTSSLDADGVELVERLLDESSGTRTVLLATHDRAFGEARCERAAELGGTALRVLR
jgi:ATPase subunit of ABC transporter with duplicated ATPase domains